MPENQLETLQTYIAEVLGRRRIDSFIELNELTVWVPREAIASALITLRDDEKCRFNMLLDICSVDWPEREHRFDVVYNLLSLPYNWRVRIKVAVAENMPVPSVVDVFPAANWFEREVYDLYGVKFEGHPDLRRLLTDYGFEGHPLRKDFPLTGYVEVRYDTKEKRVVYEPVKLPQDFRSFDNMSPWEGMTDMMLPGDEKAAVPLGAKK
jgi:NADH-quinone oxidoreductase subunit C